MDERRRGGWERTPNLAARIAAEIESSLEAKLRASGGEPLPRGGEAALDRRRRFLAAAEDAIARREGAPRP
jgi:hypothetical protein